MATSGPVVVLHALEMGRGDDELGAKLTGSFLRTLVSTDPKPDCIVFYNAAVKLLSSESPVLDTLRQLDDTGVDLLACVTCLEFFGLTERIAVGHVSNMREIAQRLLAASNVVTI